MSEFQKWTNVAIGAMVVCVLLLLFQLFGPKGGGRSAKWTTDRIKYTQEISEYSKKVPAKSAELQKSIWEEPADLLSASVMSKVEEAARQNNLTVGSFRPLKPEPEAGLVRQMYTVTVEGSFAQVIQFLRVQETPGSRIGVKTVQLASTDGVTDAVSASISLVVYQKAPLAAKNDKKTL